MEYLELAKYEKRERADSILIEKSKIITGFILICPRCSKDVSSRVPGSDWPVRLKCNECGLNLCPQKDGTLFIFE